MHSNETPARSSADLALECLHAGSPCDTLQACLREGVCAKYPKQPASAVPLWIRLRLRARAALISVKQWAARSRRAHCDTDGPDDGELEHMWSWSISARLAAVPPSYLDQVPPQVASLIRSAKTLHPQMAAGAVDREQRGEPCPDF